MTVISDAKQFVEQWLAAVERGVDAGAGRFTRVRRILLDEGIDGTFTATMAAAKSGQTLSPFAFRLGDEKPQPAIPEDWKAAFRGGRIEVRLQSIHVMARLLEFPSKAVDFLDGMIRSQIDRLTPWSASEAVFGWGVAKQISNERIEVAFAATSRLKVDPLVRLAKSFDAASVVIAVAAETDSGASTWIMLLDQRLRSAIGLAVNVPRLLRAALLSVALAAAASLLLNVYLGGSLQSELQDLQHRIAQRRTALRLDASGASGLGLLAKRKQTTASSVMVLEALSRLLPDSTYVTELRIEGDKVQVMGMTQDAPSLIRLMEQSRQFTRATFFAPTTHAANESGERFHIEAHITPYFGSGS